MTTTVANPSSAPRPRPRVLVALVTSVVAMLVVVGAAGDRSASSGPGPVAETRVAPHNQLPVQLVDVKRRVLAGQGRGAAVVAAEDALGSRVAPQATGNAYSVAFETQLDDAVLGSSRSVHFNRANAALDDALRSDSAFASQFDELIPGASGAVSRTGGRATPGGYTWHHAPSSAAGGRVGVMQLVPTWQHAPGSIWQRLLHPGGSGGYSEWAIPRGAPK